MITINISKQLYFNDGLAYLRAETTLQAGCITALYGPSGAGKTTVLKILAGLVRPETGRIEVSGNVWLDTSRSICIPPQQRNIGFVFQDYALFPNMTVQQNLLYAAGKNPDKKYIGELLHLVNMEAFANSKPTLLSGGQQQRVALIRALARKPQLLLLDEPLSALDDMMRRTLRDELYSIQRQLKITTLLVSHDISEVFALATHIIQLERGNIVAQGTPGQLFGALNTDSEIQLTGEVLHVKHDGVVCNVELQSGNDIVRIAVPYAQAAGITIGDKVLVHARVSNAGIMKTEVLERTGVAGSTEKIS